MLSVRSASLLAVLALALAASSRVQRVAGSEELPEVLETSHADAAAAQSLLRASRTLLRAGNRPVLAVKWNGMRRPISRWVRAGSVVSFTWTRPGGLSYGYSKCRSKGVLKRPTGKATVLVKIPRGRFWFFDNYRGQCSKAAIYIIGY
jgi:hypothetical protein